MTTTRTLRDGGTRHVGTAAGMLHLPATIGGALPARPTWDGIPGTRLDLDDHVLVLGEDLTVVPRAPPPTP